jgi:hypothetical protein
MVWIPSDFDIFYQYSRWLITKCIEFTDNVHASNHNIYCLTKTWLNYTIFSHNVFPAFCSVFRGDIYYLNSHILQGGGVLFAVSNLLQSAMRRHSLQTTKNCVWIEILVSDNFSLRVLIGSHYFPPDCNFTMTDTEETQPYAPKAGASSQVWEQRGRKEKL